MRDLLVPAGALLDLAFCAFALMLLLDLVPEQPPPPEGSPEALFLGAFMPLTSPS